MRSERLGYLAMAVVIFLSVIGYSLFLKPATKVKAATVGTTSSATATQKTPQRKVVVTSTGTLVAFFNTGTQSVTGIAYATSTDNGATWSAATQVDATQTDDISVTIDKSDNIYVAYADHNCNGAAKFRLLTYSAGSWSIGAAVTIVSDTCTPLSNTNVNVDLTVLSNGKLMLIYLGSNLGEVGVTYSTNSGTTWSSSGASFPTTAGTIDSNMVADGLSSWVVASGTLYADLNGSGTFQYVTALAGTPTSVSLSYGLDSLHILYENSNNIDYASYNIATGVLSATTVISSAANDVPGVIISDSQNLWAVYQSYVAANSYNVVFKRFNGTSWDASATALTTDNLNNANINAPQSMPNTANVPVIWTTGTASPYTIKSATFSTIGTVTDSGDQTGSLTGSLTGSSGDTIVKCGVWYYNTINIVSGMTIKVCASNGQVGGTLELHATSITVAGTIDGAGRGSPGGVSIVTIGGTGGLGGTVITNIVSAGVAGTAGGAAAASSTGGTGSGSYGASGGSAGTSSSSGGTAGAGGASGNDSLNYGALGGGAGGGATGGGSASSIGGYGAAGTNGDATTDETLLQGSGGGAGGNGGAGAGGGGGGSGGDSGGTNVSGVGGAGGNGGNGGIGGKGGNGGAWVKIYSSGTLVVSGSILTNGQAGGSGGAGQSGQSGQNGGYACQNC